MSTVVHYPHISIDASGTARIGDTRYKVTHLAAEHYHYGVSAEELLRWHPDLRPEQVYAALTYIYDHYTEIVEELNRNKPEDIEGVPWKSLSRNELLRRLAAKEK